ncbi:BrnT family toxin [Castellaniella sp.]|uniref:BrnT family toxin n=1 Tax=Castellaniella sp. TaxID=1955812 RepID=UPI002AFF0283|nr:BrnT family toxin [Castellaniella sp.]
MEIEFDPAKDESNIAKHGISLSRAVDMEILSYVEDERNAYGEARYRAWGLIDGKAHCLAFTYRENRIRAISLRRAHKKEMARHAP